MLEPGINVGAFTTYDELPGKCLEYLENPEAIEEITVAGYEKVSASHTVLLRALEIVKLILSEKLS